MADARRFEGASPDLSSWLPRHAHAGGEGTRAVLSSNVVFVAKWVDLASVAPVLAENLSTTPSRCEAKPKIASFLAAAVQAKVRPIDRQRVDDAVARPLVEDPKAVTGHRHGQPHFRRCTNAILRQSQRCREAGSMTDAPTIAGTAEATNTAPRAETADAAVAAGEASFRFTPAAVSQHQAFPSFMLAISASGPEMDQPRPLPEAYFVPRILRETKTVTPPITPPQPPVAASVTPP
jgi:hypothetical protein